MSRAVLSARSIAWPSRMNHVVWFLSIRWIAPSNPRVSILIASTRFSVALVLPGLERLSNNSHARLIAVHASRVSAVRTARALLRAMSRQRTIDPGCDRSSVRNRATFCWVGAPPFSANASTPSVTAIADCHAASPAGVGDSASSLTVASTSRAMKSARST